MNCTTKINKNQQLKYQDASLDIENFKDFMEPWELNEYKKMIGQESGQYISRRQCILAAIEQQLSELAIKHPQRKIGLVLFDNEVLLLGDGQAESITLAGDKLNNKEQCLNESVAASKNILKTSISDSSKSIVSKLENITANGKTALGPGLVAAFGLASQGAQGSKILLCTDGLSNVGFGALDTIQALQDSNQFYQQLAQEAKQKGISISIITIAGEQCNVEALGCLVEETEGQITRVNPESVSNDFSQILKEDIIATNVELKVFLHQALRFKNEQMDIIFKDGSLMQRSIGNVTNSSEISFQYSIKSMEELEKLNIDIDKIESVPFQAQIFYNTNKGRFKVSRDLEEVKDNAEFKILAAHIQQKSSAQILSSNFEGAKQELDSWKPILNAVSKNRISSDKNSTEINMKLYLENEVQLKNAIEIKEEQKKKVQLPSIEEEKNQFDSCYLFNEEQKQQYDEKNYQIVPYSEENEVADVNLLNQKKAKHNQYL